MLTIPDEIRTQLSAGEQVLWSGRPRQGVVLRASDALLIPFSLLWAGFAVFWESSVIATGAPLIFKLWGIPFVVVGAYMVFGRFFAEARQRGRTWYAVTNQRVLIVSGHFQRKLQSLDLTALNPVTLTEGRDNRGSIAFGESRVPSAFQGMGSWPGMAAHLPPRFDLIEGPKAVFETIRTAQRSAGL